MTSATTANTQEATVVVVNPPMRYPNSMLLREIADREVADTVKEEEVVRAELADLREKKRAIKTTCESLLRNCNAAKSKAHQKFDHAINELHMERRRLQAALDDFRARQGSRASARDKVTDLECELRIATRSCEEAEALMQLEQDNLKNGIGARKSSEQKKVVERCRKELAVRAADKMAKEEAYTKARVEWYAATPDFAERSAREEEFRELRVQLNAVMDQLETVNQQRRAANAAGSDGDELDSARAELNDVDAALASAEARVADLRGTLFPESHHFCYNAAYHQALIGRGGATLRQLQEDFGVAVCVDTLPAGHGYVVGGAAEAQACIEAITAVVTDEEAKNASTTLTFAEPQFRKELIGPRGSTVDRFQDEYDVRLQLSDTGVTISGRRHDVAEAKEAIQAHLESFTTRVMTVAISALPTLLGRGGRNITRISDSSGVRALRVDRERGVLKATGTPDAIERAFALCRCTMGDGDGVTKVVHADDAWVRAIIGPSGSTIRQLEEDTGAHVQCSGNTVTLTGSQEAVSKVYERVVALRRAERAILASDGGLHFLTSRIVSLAEVDECRSPTVRTPTATQAGSSFITPLEAVRRATECDHVVPLRAEGSVIMRGSPEAVDNAYGILKLLLRHNEPFAINVAFLDILRNFMTSRRREWDNKSLLDYIPSLFASPIRFDVDWAARRVKVSSCSARETRAATNKLVDCLREYSATHVRLISNFPQYAISRLLGTRGSTIRQLQEATDSEIMLVRDREQVQVLNAAGDVEKLESAVHAIRVAVFGEEDEDGEDGEELTQSPGEAFAAQTPTRRVAKA